MLTAFFPKFSRSFPGRLSASGSTPGTLQKPEGKNSFYSSDFRNNLRHFFIKLLSWEYWPTAVVYFPVSFYYLFLALRARSFYFFSAANPGIETGGLFFESKWSIYQLLPEWSYPTTVFISESLKIDAILNEIQSKGLKFPLIAKPDRGERGWCVQKINSASELEKYRENVPVDFLLQEYIDQPLELSVYYFRKPDAEHGIVSSLTQKVLLQIKGDGKSTIAEHIQRNPRAFLQRQVLINNPDLDLNEIVMDGETRILVPYGNHVRGAMFVNLEHEIDPALTKAIDSIATQIPGFFVGRFDLRCSSLEDLRNGTNISILELNGVGAEPSHIYHPGYSFFKAQKDIARHMKMIFQAAMINKKRSVAFMTAGEYALQKSKQLQYKSKVCSV